ADHIADKVWATIQTYGPQEGASSRTRDLYYLCALAHSERLLAADLTLAIDRQRQLRGMPTVKSISVPCQWRALDEELASTHPGASIPLGFDDAVAKAVALVDPILSGDVTTGTWNPTRQTWKP